MSEQGDAEGNGVNVAETNPVTGVYPSVAMDRTASRLTLGWICLGVYALLAAGILALLLAFSRTPAIQDLFPGTDFFRVALVAHVDLSVLIWFIAGAGVLWSVLGSGPHSSGNWLGFVLSVVGTVMISVAPFVGAGRPLMNNYVPVLQHPWFYVGLVAVGAGLVVQAASFLFANTRQLVQARGSSPLRLALSLAALAALLAVGCVICSYLRISAATSGEFYFDLLFWGGGHVLQFMHTMLMLVAFVLLLSASGISLPGSPRLHSLLLALVVAPLLAVPWMYTFAIESREHILNFTALMRYGGMACIPMLLLVIVTAGKRSLPTVENRPLRAALICSLALFVGGGVMGFMIQGSNTVIPAHYHGSIVGVTLAYMGVFYLILPRIGKPITMPRAAHWQPYVYGIGQVMHVTALAWTGGYGVKRKTAGAAQGLDSIQEVVGMGMMGLGGLVAVIGGMLFLVVVLAALLRRRQEADPGR